MESRNGKSANSDFTQGSVGAHLLRMAAPMTLALLVNVLYNIVDRMYIGHIPDIGRDALTGVGLVFPITSVVAAFHYLCSSGGSPIFSIARGEGDEEQAALIQGNAFAMLLIFAVLLTAVSLAVKKPVLWLIGASPTTFDYANDYLSIYLLGTLFVMISLGMNPFINAQGFSVIGMFTVGIGAVINIVLDPIFIYAFDMGVRGAAVATVIAQFCSALWVLFFLTGKKAVCRLGLKYMRLQPKLLLRMMGLGMTGFTFQLTNSAMVMVYNIQLLRLGNGSDIWVSAMTVISSLREVLYMPISGITKGAHPILGYNYGAKQYQRVRHCIKLMLFSCLLYLLVICLLLMLWPRPFISIFNNDPELIEVTSQAMRWFFVLLPFMGLQLAGQNTFVALGRAKYSVFFSIFRKVVLVVPLALILPELWGLGVAGVFLSEPISDLIGGGACFTTMMLTVWRELKRREKEEKERQLQL